MVRRADGALLSAAIAPYPAMLYASVRGQRWEEAVRLCRSEFSPRIGQTMYKYVDDLSWPGRCRVVVDENTDVGRAP